MGLKKFLKPKIEKFVFFLILMGGINYISISVTNIPKGGDILAGLPLAFYPLKNAVLDTRGYSHMSFSFTNFAIDIVFWYVISCVAFFLYTKIISKKINNVGRNASLVSLAWFIREFLYNRFGLYEI